MTVLTEFAPAKINLALHVLGRRSDGYHDLDSIVAFADVGDRLTFEAADRFSIAASGPFARQLPPPTDNIVFKAWEALNRLAGGIAPLRVTLEKNLPVSSGIGGGSANAAATLRALIRMIDLPLPEAETADLALSLGADVPVCLEGRACRMQGIGERLAPVPGLGPYHAVLVNPGLAVATADIFQAMGLTKGASHRQPVATMDIAGWRNDLTEAAAALVPAIAEVLDELNDQPGLVTARMSGSGATCFGIFETANAARHAAAGLARPGWWVVPVLLQ